MNKEFLSAEIKKKRPHMQNKKVLFYQDNASRELAPLPGSAICNRIDN